LDLQNSLLSSREDERLHRRLWREDRDNGHGAREPRVRRQKRGSRRKDVIAVVLGSDDDVATTANRYTDSTALLDWALDRP